MAVSSHTLSGAVAAQPRLWTIHGHVHSNAAWRHRALPGQLQAYGHHRHNQERANFCAGGGTARRGVAEEQAARGPGRVYRKELGPRGERALPETLVAVPQNPAAVRMEVLGDYLRRRRAGSEH